MLTNLQSCIVSLEICDHQIPKLIKKKKSICESVCISMSVIGKNREKIDELHSVKK